MHQVDTEHRLGHGVLDLQARVGLDEHKGIRPLGVGLRIEQELEGAQVFVLRGASKRHGRLGDARPQGFTERRARRDFDELLMAPLHRAFPLPQMADRAAGIADHLHFDVPGIDNEPLHIDLVAPEGGPGF